VPTTQGFEANACGPNGPVDMELAALDDLSGQLIAQLMPVSAGTYTVSCRYKGNHISGSPWELQAAPGVAVAYRSLVQGVPSTLVSGKSENVVIIAKDKHGNVTRGGDHVIVDIEDCNGRKSLLVSDNHDGTYSTELSPVTAGSFTLMAFVNNKLVELPKALMVQPGKFHALISVSEKPITCRAGEGFSLSLAAVDVNGNRLSSRTGRTLRADITQKV